MPSSPSSWAHRRAECRAVHDHAVATSSRRAPTAQPSSPGHRQREAAAPVGRVRIIGGQWKRTPLQVPDVTGLRPTPDRVRETLFNWLGQSLEGWRCLDLFAGTGALGLEAASRGAERVVMVERDRRAHQAIAEVVARLAAGDRIELIAGDAQAALARWATEDHPRFDLVFLDPPFAQDWIARVWPAVERCVVPSGRVYVESESRFSPPSDHWQIERAGRAGQVHYHLLRQQEPIEG